MTENTNDTGAIKEIKTVFQDNKPYVFLTLKPSELFLADYKRHQELAKEIAEIPYKDTKKYDELLKPRMENRVKYNGWVDLDITRIQETKGKIMNPMYTETISLDNVSIPDFADDDAFKFFVTGSNGEMKDNIESALAFFKTTTRENKCFEPLTDKNIHNIRSVINCQIKPK